MYGVALSRDHRRISLPTLCVVAAGAAFFLMLANAALVGGSIAARAGAARALANADESLARAAQLETHVARTTAPTIAAASRAGFVSPHSFSYTTTRPLGSAASLNDL